jgi:sec-independent protein translocase protein TatA
MVPIPLAFISGIGVWEIMVILVVALIVFGPRLPQVARTVGKGYMEFKRGLRTLEGQIEFGDIDVEVSNPRNGGSGEIDTPPVPTPDRVGEVDP